MKICQLIKYGINFPHYLGTLHTLIQFLLMVKGDTLYDPFFELLPSDGKTIEAYNLSYFLYGSYKGLSIYPLELFSALSELLNAKALKWNLKLGGQSFGLRIEFFQHLSTVMVQGINVNSILNFKELKTEL